MAYRLPMSLVRRLVLVAVAFLLSSALSFAVNGAPKAAQEATSGADAFAREYAVVTDLQKEGNWKATHAGLIALLESHEGADYVRPHLPEIREAVQRAAFWSKHGRPDPEDLVSGSLRNYQRSNGKIWLEYDRDQLEDFEKVANYLMHPLRFRGECTVEMVGPPAELAQIALLVDLVEDRGYMVAAGDQVEDGIFYTKHSIARLEGGRSELLEQKDPRERKKKKSVRDASLKVTLSKSKLTVRYNNAQIFKVAREDDDIGQVGFVAPARFTSYSIRGRAETAWIEGRVDAAMQDEREAFEESYKEPAVFASWPAAAPPSAKRKTDIDELASKVALPDKLTPSQIKFLNTVSLAINGGDLEEALRLLDEETPAQFPEATRHFIAMTVHMRRRDAQSAIASIDAMETIKALSPDLARIRVILHMNSELYAAALEGMTELLEKDPTDIEMWVNLATVRMIQGNFDAARDDVVRALQAAPTDPDLVDLRAQVAKATHGPSWKKTHEEVGERAIVRTDIGARVGRILAREAEDTLARLEELHGQMPAAEHKVIVYVFSGEATYLEYIQGVAPNSPEQAVGIYSPRLKQALISNQPDRKELLAVVRHELTHAYMDRVLGVHPIWFGEGVAEYVAAARQEGRSWVEGSASGEHIETLKLLRHRKITVEQLLYMPQASFMTNGLYTYPMSWAFVDHLLHSTPENRVLFEQLWAALAKSIDADDALRAVLEGVDLKSLDNEFWSALKKKQ